MRVEGDPVRCRASARELHRAATAVDATIRAADLPSWSGLAADRCRTRLSLVDGFTSSTSARLSQLAAALGEHADGLEELQGRARGLAAEADAAGLPVDAAGRIPPVPLVLDAEGLVLARRQAAVRQELVARVAALRAAEDALHQRLLRRTTAPPASPTEDGRSADGGHAWAPGGWDLPSAALNAADSIARTAPDVPASVGRLAGSTVVGGAVTTIGELAQGKSVDDSFIKGTVLTGAGALASGAVVAVLGPGVLAAGIGFVAGAGVGYAGSRVFDRYGHHLPFVDRPSAGRRSTRSRRASAPTCRSR